MPEWETRELKIEDIEIPSRRVSAHMDDAEREALAASIERFGLFSEPLVHEREGHLILISGKNRLDAVRARGEQTIRCKVWKGSLSDALLSHLAENFAKGRISALDLYNYVRDITAEQSIDIGEISRMTGLSVSKLSTALRIGDLEDEIKQALLHDAITDSHALLLARIKDPEQRREVFRAMIELDLTVEDAQKYWWHGFLSRCDCCEREGQELQQLFKGTDREVWVCPECMSKSYPDVAKLLEAREAEIKKLVEEGRFPESMAELMMRCSMCTQEFPAKFQRAWGMCRECNAKLLRLLDNFDVQVGKKLHECPTEDLDRIMIKRV